MTDQWSIEEAIGAPKPPAVPAAPPSEWTVAQAGSPILSAPRGTTGPEGAIDVSALGPGAQAFHNFTEQAGRAATFGLQDKVGAAVPVVNAAIGDAINAGARGIGVSEPFAGSADKSYSDLYHDELLRERGVGEAYAENHPIASKIATTLGTAASVAPTMGAPGAAPTVAVTPGLGARVTQGAKGGATAGALTGFGNSNDESLGQTALDTAKGAGIGAGLGGALGAVAGAAGSAPSAETAQLAQMARDQYGIPIVGAQISESPAVRFLYSQLKKVPFSGAGNDAAPQQGAFNRAVAQSFGETADKITPDVLLAARGRIGQQFNDVASRTSIPASPQLLTDLQGVVDRAALTTSADSVVPVEKQAMNIINTAAANRGDIGGRAYIDLTAKGGPLDTMMQSSDSGIRRAGIELRNVLDDHLQQAVSPDDLAALKTARTQWKAMKTVEPLTVRADAIGTGATPSTGDISPAALRSVVNQSYNNVAMARPGEIPLNDLARVGQRFLKEPADSGTATREMFTHGLGALGALGGAVTAGTEAGVPLAYTLGSAGGTLVGSRLASALLRSGPYTNRLINSGLTGNSGSAGLARALSIGAAPSTVGLLTPPRVTAPGAP